MYHAHVVSPSNLLYLPGHVMAHAQYTGTSKMCQAIALFNRSFVILHRIKEFNTDKNVILLCSSKNPYEERCESSFLF